MLKKKKIRARLNAPHIQPRKDMRPKGKIKWEIGLSLNTVGGEEGEKK